MFLLTLSFLAIGARACVVSSVYVLQRFGVVSDISAFCNDVPLRSASVCVIFLRCPFSFAFVFGLQFQDFILAIGRIMKRVCRYRE